MSDFGRLRELRERHLQEEHRQPRTAISVEAMAYLEVVLDGFEERGLTPLSVVELGTGLSSWVLQSWVAADEGHGWALSYDHSWTWANRTRDELERVLGIRVPVFAGAGALAGFLADPPHPIRVVFVDAHLSVRRVLLELVEPHVAPEGVIVLDDFHLEGWAEEARAFLEDPDRGSGRWIVDVQANTRDEYGRYMAIAWR